MRNAALNPLVRADAAAVQRTGGRPERWPSATASSASSSPSPPRTAAMSKARPGKRGRRCAAAVPVGDASSVGGTRPSMLQDVLAGRPTEVETILGQLQAFAREAGVPCRASTVWLPLMRGLDRSRASAQGLTAGRHYGPAAWRPAHRRLPLATRRRKKSPRKPGRRRHRYARAAPARTAWCQAAVGAVRLELCGSGPRR